jgi:hypothetical protein
MQFWQQQQPILLSRPRVKSTRRFWVRPSLTARKRYCGTDLLGDLAKDDVDPLTREIRCDGSFKNFIRMTSSDFEYLIMEIGHKIGKKDTTFRDAIPVRERLAVTLRFLASLSLLFKFSKQSISLIVPEVCDALIECFNNMLSSVDKSEHVIKQCFKTTFDLYRQLMDNIKHVIKQEKCYKTLRYIKFFLSFF